MTNPYYYTPRTRRARRANDEGELGQTIERICTTFSRYGHRRVTAPLRFDDGTVNPKRVVRIRCEQGLSVRLKRCYVRTTDSEHGGPIFPHWLRDGFIPPGPNQLWVTGLTYLRIQEGFVYWGAILDTWSRRAIGYVLSRQTDTPDGFSRVTLRDRARQPFAGYIHHSERGTQYASAEYRKVRNVPGLVGSMSRCGYDNALRPRVLGRH